MEQELFNVLSKLEMQDEREKMRGPRLINALDPDAAKLISMLAVSKKATQIVEIGSGVGYSTLWLAYAAAITGGKVVSCELDSAKAAEAQQNLEKAQMSAHVELLTGDGRELLRNRTEPVDLLFLDGEPAQYEAYLDVVYKLMDVGAMVIADDAVTLESDLLDYIGYVQNHPNMESVTVPVGEGLEITVRTSA